MYSKSPLTKGLAIISIVATILIAAVIVYTCHNACMSDNMWYLLICAAIIAGVLLWAIIVSPKGVSVDEEGNITVHLVACKIRIAKDNVVKIRPFPSDRGTIRLIGSGGLYGYMGLFRNTEIGTFSCYATDLDKSIVIYRKNKRPMVVTVEDPSIFDVLRLKK